MYNSIVTLCHLVKDPELRKTTTGKAVCTLRVCVSPSEAKDKAYIDVELWERKAEIAGEYLKKGREILVNGALCMSSWGEGENRRSKHYIKGQDFQFVGGGKKSEDDADAPAAPTPDNGDDDDVPF